MPNTNTPTTSERNIGDVFTGISRDLNTRFLLNSVKSWATYGDRNFTALCQALNKQRETARTQAGLSALMEKTGRADSKMSDTVSEFKQKDPAQKKSGFISRLMNRGRN